MSEPTPAADTVSCDVPRDARVADPVPRVEKAVDSGLSDSFEKAQATEKSITINIASENAKTANRVSDFPCTDEQAAGELVAIDIHSQNTQAVCEPVASDSTLGDAQAGGELVASVAHPGVVPEYVVVDILDEDALAAGEPVGNDAPRGNAPAAGEPVGSDAPPRNAPAAGEPVGSDALPRNAPAAGEPVASDAPSGNTQAAGEPVGSDAPPGNAPAAGEPVAGTTNRVVNFCSKFFNITFKITAVTIEVIKETIKGVAMAAIPAHHLVDILPIEETKLLLIVAFVWAGSAIKKKEAEIRNIGPGCLQCEVHCFTEDIFLEIVRDYEAGRIKNRLEEEYLKAGYKITGLEVKIKNSEEIERIKTAIEKRYGIH